MKILELTGYSAGICGVWNRVKEESIRLSDLGHEVRVFSSNFVKGKNEFAPREEKIGHVKITRFSAKKIGGESYMKWNYEDLKKEVKKFMPEIIIAHSYRHTHTVIASKLAREIGAKTFLVTHSPFGHENRSLIAKLYISLFYDAFIGKRTLKHFNKIIAITKWELPYLSKLGVRKENIVYIPNGIPEQFFKQKKSKETKKILFLGRISNVKNLETLILAMKYLDVELEIVGPAEEEYLQKLKKIIKINALENKIKFLPPIYHLTDKIKKIDSAKIFVLPSKREAMPQALIEAMSREKIVVASNNKGALDLIKNGYNGYLFETGNVQDLVKKIKIALEGEHSQLRKNAKKSVIEFSWKDIIIKIDSLVRKGF